ASSKRPLRSDPEGFRWCDIFICDEAESALGPVGNQGGGIDDPQRLGVVAALQAERFVVRSVDIDYLTGAQADPDPRRRSGALVREVVDHGVKAAMASARLVERDHALAAERGQNGLAGSHRSEVLDPILGTCRKTKSPDDQGTEHSICRKLAETEHGESPFAFRAGPS